MEECKNLHEFVSYDRQIHVNLRKECKNSREECKEFM